jgi:hypothetical protein
MMKTAKVSKAESAGVENEEKSSATATTIINSTKIKMIAGQIDRTSGS